MSTFNSNTRIRIEELIEKNGVELDNLMIVEDKDDTKKTTVREFIRALIGDHLEPDANLFYSTNKVSEMILDLRRLINLKGDKKKIEELYNMISDIIVSNGDGNKDTELIAARNGASTLSDRLDRDAKIIDSKYMRKISKTVTGKMVNINGHHGYVDISVIKSPTPDSMIGINNVSIKSKNVLNINDMIAISLSSSLNGVVTSIDVIKNDNYGYVFTETDKEVYNKLVEIPLPQVQNAGKYILYASKASQSDDFVTLDISVNISYIDGTIEKIPYSHSETLEIEALKSFNKISFDYSDGPFVEGSYIKMDYIMLIPEAYYMEAVEKYLPYARYDYNNMKIGDSLHDIYDVDYIYECNIQNAMISVSYYDTNITTEWLYDEITNLKSVINNKIDHCGLIKDYGEYLFLDNMYISSYEDGVTISDCEDKYIRNGVYSKKITISSNAMKNTIFKIPFTNAVNVIENIGVMFFIDKTVSSMFDSKTGGIKIRLCSDSITGSSEVNYYEYLITKTEMVQGWNFIKRRLVDFTSIGNPNPNSIQYIHFEICRTDEMGGCSIYLNGFVFNQMMKPSVLVCFNGVYDDSIRYLYPYMKTRGIKPTIFLNSKQTLDAETIDTILSYKYNNDWDIGLDGCHPNKEILVQDDNYRNQYIAIKNSLDWLNSNMVNHPISYSAAYGNLRPITTKVIEDFGMKIVKTNVDGYCGFFSEMDLALPSILINNETNTDEIIDKIDYAIETGQAIILYTNDVTEYGSEIDAKKVIFELIIDYIHDRVELGKLESLTFREFYNKCMN